MTRMKLRLLSAVLLCAATISSSACAVRYVVLEPEDAAARLQAPVIAHVVNPIVDDQTEPVALRIRVTAPRDSSVTFQLGAPKIDSGAAILQQPTRCGSYDENLERIALRLCRLASPEQAVSESVFLATVEYARGNNPFNVRRPIKVHLHRDIRTLIIRAGHDTTFHLAVPLRDPNFDYEHSRYGVDLSWQTRHVDTKSSPTARSLYERASFRRVNYRWTPLLTAIAFGVIAGSTQR